MAGQYQMNGNQGGPTPWWQLPGGGAARDNLESSAPDKYRYNPVDMQYQRTPLSKGQDAAATMNGMFQNNSALNGLTGGGGSGSGSGGGGVTGSGSGVNGGQTIAPITLPDQTAATNAAFATAKDKVGALSRSSLTSLNDELGASGMVGSGAQVQGTRDIIQSGAGQMGQVSRDLAGKQADLAADFAKTSYQGGITQRGQDIAAQEANARLAAEERARQQQLLESILRGLGGGGSGGSGTGGTSY